MTRVLWWIVGALSGLGILLMIVSLGLALGWMDREAYSDRMIVVGLWSFGAGVLATGFTIWAQRLEDREREARMAGMRDCEELGKIITGKLEGNDWAKGDRKTCPDCGRGWNGKWKTEYMSHSQHCWIAWHLNMGPDYWDAQEEVLDLLWPLPVTEVKEGVE